MSEAAILAWMKRIDERLDVLQSSVAKCQGRCEGGDDAAGGETLPSVGRGKSRAALLQAIAYVVSAAAGALGGQFLGK